MLSTPFPQVPQRADAAREASSAALRFGILGPLQVLEHGRPADLGSRKQQIVLAVLLCNANALVPVDSLVEALWNDEPPRTARKNIQVYVSGLRNLISSGSLSRISYQTGGYVFQTQVSELDSLSFEQQARAGQKLRRTEQPTVVAEVLKRALDLWRGRPLDGLRGVPIIGATARRLERQFLTVFEDWAEAEIAAGNGKDAIDRITELTHEHPLRERLRALQMTALCQAERRSEALAVYAELRQTLAHDLGLSPSPAMVALYRSVLNEQEPPELRSAVPASRRQATPSLLPWDPPTFTGRTEPIQQLAGALVHDRHRLAVLTGPFGSGKTAVAVHTAHQLYEAFSDGRFFVRLRGEDGTLRAVDDVMSELIWAVRSWLGPQLTRGGGRAWRRWLAEHQALVVIDDARKASEVRPFLPEAGDSAVIVTSRFMLPGLESTFHLRLPALSMSDALTYLGRIVGDDRIAADRPSAEAIAAATGLFPLPLRLVAERLALLRHVPLREYAVRIAAAPDLLDELAAAEAGIRLLLANAINELPEPARQAAHRLGLLPSPVFTLEKAAAVLDTDEGTATRLLEHLLEVSVVTVVDTVKAEKPTGAVTYQIPPLVYAFARELAAGQPDPRCPT